MVNLTPPEGPLIPHPMPPPDFQRRAYATARQWAQAIHDHPQKIDGIRYRSRHDDARYCYGIFDRCANELQEKNVGNLLESNPRLLAKILDFYSYALL
jgi:RES domain